MLFIIKKLEQKKHALTFVLTARSGRFANQRLYQFLKSSNIYPTEVFHTGRVSKKLQLERLMEDFPNRKVIFIEDSEKQVRELESYFEQNNSIVLLHIKYPELNHKKQMKVRSKYLEDMEKAIKSKQQSNLTDNLEYEKMALEHGVKLFTFHAQQRNQSFRYYFTAFAIIVTGLISIFSNDFQQKNELGIYLSIILILLTLMFWAMDKRNSMLVNCDERLILDIEERIQSRSGLVTFQTMKFSDEQSPKFIRYSIIMPAIFSVFLLIGITALIYFLISKTRLDFKYNKGIKFKYKDEKKHCIIFIGINSLLLM